MPSFVPPFDVADKVLLPDLQFTFPDPERAPGDPLVRPGLARYPEARMSMLRVARADGAAFDVVAPVTGSVRRVDVPDDPDSLSGAAILRARGIVGLAEISPLPFAIVGTLRRLRQGLPTFYLGCGTPPDDDTLIEANDPLGSTTELFVGVVFQDRAALAPRTWVEVIGAAMAPGEPQADVTAWNGLLALFAGLPSRVVRVIDHAGKPAEGATLEIDAPSGTVVTAGAGGEIDLSAIQGDSIRLTGLALPRTDPTEPPTIAPTPQPVSAIYDTGASAEPGRPILLPASPLVTLQVLELSRWFANRTASVPLPSFHTNSRLEPLVDGIPTYERLVADLVASAGPEGGARLAGWVFKNFPLLGDGNGSSTDTSIIGIAEQIRAEGGDVLFLVNTLVNVRSDLELQLILRELAGAAVMFGLLGSALVVRSVTNHAGHAALAVGLGALVASTVTLGLVSPSDVIEKLAEDSLDFLEAANELQRNIAIHSPYPATVDDNPVGHPQTVNIPLVGEVDFGPAINQFGVYHQKIQAIKRHTPDTDGNTFVAYLGGIDLDESRVDDAGHNGRGTLETGDALALDRTFVYPFHDVHARVTGPAASDVFKTWDERYAFDVEQNHLFDAEAEPVVPQFLAPEPEDVDPSGEHIVQIGRTYYRVENPPGPFGFAPEGESTTGETLIRAVRSAVEYIYIEDQYFTPNARETGTSPDGNPDTFFDALVAAERHCRRLVILVPTETDQLFGDLRRRFLFDRLREAWGDRVLVGAPIRRPLLPHAGRVASVGRCWLSRKAEEDDVVVYLRPAARASSAPPFWLWIDGELMLARTVVTLGANVDELEVHVVRADGANPRWGAAPRWHLAGAPVTMSQPKGIYVHSKVTMIDDVFVAIGSSNANRRGYLHDGEIHAFAIPQALKAAADNPARALRTALWAEHLGLPPSMGSPLFDDPVAAFEHFRRSTFEGNRFTPFAALDVQAQFGSALSASTFGLVMQGLGATVGLAEVRTFWDDASDPTSHLDPDARSGPIPVNPEDE